MLKLGKGLAVLAAAILSLAAFSAKAEDYVTKDEFEKFKQEFEKYKAANSQLNLQNENLKAKNADLAKTVEDLKEGKTRPMSSALDSLMTQDSGAASKDDFDKVRSGTTKFLLSGWADAGYEDRHGRNSTFTSSFHPEFIWKLNDQISFDSDFEAAEINYHFHDLVTFQAGRFHTQFDQFNSRLYPTWINKMPDRPLVFSEDNPLVPFTSLGANLSGGFDAGPAKFNWAAYVTNGPQLNTFSPSDFGSLEFDNSTDNNRDKALGGRLGFLPVPELELGASLQYARVGAQRSPQTRALSMLTGADLSYNKIFDPLKGAIDIRAEWVWSKVGNAVYSIGGDDVPFNNNRRNGGYAQIAYRPVQIDQKWVKNLELAYRFEHLENPAFTASTPVEARPTRGERTRNTIGLNYWLGPSTVLKFAYEQDSREDNSLLIQFAIGF